VRLTVITSNEGKMKEYAQALSVLGIEVVQCRIPYTEIQADTLEEVVLNGIEQLTAERDSFIIDDSGLFIKKLNGFPGVYSAYVMKTLGNEGILKLMDGVENREANFCCCIGCKLGGKEPFTVSAACPGVILRHPIGKGGFGFDPIFSHDGTRSFAEIDTTEKNSISHRGLAIAKLVEVLKGRREL